MGNTPSPRVIRHPIPTNNRIPDPSSVKIGPPFGMINIRNPDMPIRPFINPTAIIG